MEIFLKVELDRKILIYILIFEIECSDPTVLPKRIQGPALRCLPIVKSAWITIWVPSQAPKHSSLTTSPHRWTRLTSPPILSTRPSAATTSLRALDPKVNKHIASLSPDQRPVKESEPTSGLRGNGKMTAKAGSTTHITYLSGRSRSTNRKILQTLR